MDYIKTIILKKVIFMTKTKHRIISMLLCICMVICVCSCTQNTALLSNENNTLRQAETNVAENEMSNETTDYSNYSFAVHYIDVGQGDSALVICDGKTMLIDGGKPHASDIIYTYLKNLNIDCLDYIVASHADDDHIGGLSAPLAKMKVKNVLAPETEADTRSYTSLKTKAFKQTRLKMKNQSLIKAL